MAVIVPLSDVVWVSCRLAVLPGWKNPKFGTFPCFKPTNVSSKSQLEFVMSRFLSSTVSGRNRVAMETWLLQESPGVGGLVGELGWLGFVTSETRPTRRNLKFSCNWILGGR
ncbi:hypothetical protein AXG93_4461s1460 [Marchantia polymorpha subsp. ruderalis]|uniref:Uncharacterized protein n=1 Tax=Marchantia polymorpha subsp. ruderalis TaxID=1480154 RepID=A0A176WRL4_MARPO|nr:hypothetical protein AXG93_4461s1460 [Marchantia polymorpha subsp. ruderalis]